MALRSTWRIERVACDSPRPGIGRDRWREITFRHQLGYEGTVRLLGDNEDGWWWEWSESYLGLESFIVGDETYSSRRAAIDSLVEFVDELGWIGLCNAIRFA